MMEKLLAGYGRFRTETWEHHRERYLQLAREGQRPRALVIACADSRVDPQSIFDAAPGELFVVRNVANLVPPYMPDSAYHGTSAAIEFAVRGLNVPNLIVLGHGQCGGIHMLLNGAPDHLTDFVSGWVEIAAPARKAAFACVGSPAEKQLAAEHAAVQTSLANIHTFPWVEDAIAAGTLKAHGFHFAVATGKLTRLGEDGTFQPVG